MNDKSAKRPGERDYSAGRMLVIMTLLTLSMGELVADASAASPDVAMPVVFQTNCTSCHGPQGLGAQGLGPNLAASMLVKSSSVSELTEFLRDGRPADAADNKTGIAMPGFSWMTEEQLAQVVAYLQSKAE